MAHAYHLGAGLYIGLNEGDREKLLDDYVCCKATTHKKPCIEIFVSENIKSETLEEPGFHIQGYPVKARIQDIQYYRIDISKDIRDELISPHDIKGNCFESRCKYDRIAISFFGDQK